MNESLPVPVASPVNTPVTRVLVEPLPTAPQGVSGAGYPLVRPSTDRLAIASAVCGLTAIIPVISQVMGLALGIASLVRIRRAGRAGVAVRGRGWALTGIISSGFALVGWVAMVAALLLVGSVFSQTAGSLDALALTPP